MSTVFEHVTLGQRVLFGSGLSSDHVAQEVERLGARRIMVISSQSELPMAKIAMSQTEPMLWWDEVAMHVPADVAQRACSAATESKVDLLVSVGGGSTTGLAKAIALSTGVPIVAVPTTYAGSEATNVWGLTEDHTKTTGVDDR